MKNLHLIKTDKPSRLFLNKVNNKLLLDSDTYSNLEKILPSSKYQNIYITNDENIKEGDWVYSEARNTLFKVKSKSITSTGTILIEDDVIMTLEINEVDCKKIILSTNEDLIADGVQAIDDEFLEWFVKNPSCEEVKVEKHKKPLGIFYHKGDILVDYYKIIIPKECQY